MKNKQQLRDLLNQIAQGTHDPTPTRRIHIGNKQALETDDWWQAYFLSARDSYRQLAQQAIELLEQN